MSDRARPIARYQRQRGLANRHGATRTAEIDAWHAGRLDQWLGVVKDDRPLTAIDRGTLEEFLDAFARGKDGFTEHSDAYVNQSYRSLCKFFAWLADEYEMPVNPMTRVAPRVIGEQHIDGKVLSEDELTRVLDVVAYNRRDFAAVRDHAMLRLLLIGVRRGELVGIRVEDLNLNKREVLVHGKPDKDGPRSRIVPFGDKTMIALDRYLERREGHPLADRPELWVGRRGVITGRGFHAIVKKRGEQAGLDGLHPHKFRHTFADQWLANGGNEGDLMEVAGWKSPAMPRYYARETANRRARKAARALALDDRI